LSDTFKDRLVTATVSKNITFNLIFCMKKAIVVGSGIAGTGNSTAVIKFKF
jgi:hypothetical protein